MHSYEGSPNLTQSLSLQYAPPIQHVCTRFQFGWLQTATSPNQPFYKLGSVWNQATLYNSYCDYYFGTVLKGRQPNVAETNTIYGGLNVNAVNVTFVHGSLDPWHPLGVDAGSTFDAASVYFVDQGSHCNDAVNPDLFPGSSSLKNVQQWIEFDLQWYLQGTPWAYHTTETDDASLSSALAAANSKWRAAPDDTCGFEIVAKRTKTRVKYGYLIKARCNRHYLRV
jgi:hypothetical protein